MPDTAHGEGRYTGGSGLFDWWTMRETLIELLIDVTVLAGVAAIGAATYLVGGQVALLAYIGTVLLLVGGLAAWRRGRVV